MSAIGSNYSPIGVWATDVSQKRGRNFPLISKEILVPVDKLISKYHACSENKFDAYVEGKIIKYGEVIEDAKEDYQKTISKYIKNNQGFLVPKNEHSIEFERLHLTEETLMKVVRNARLALKKAPSGNLGAYRFIKSTNCHIIASREVGGLKVIKWSGIASIDEKDDHYLGKGGYGFVQKVMDVSDPAIAAMKLASQKGMCEVFNEANKQKVINEDGKVAGIQDEVRAIYLIPFGPKKKPIYGYVGKLYNQGSNMNELRNLPVIEKYRIFLTLLKALETLHTGNEKRGPIVHGDIKPENLLVHKNSDGSFEVVLADFGGSKDLRDELSCKQKLFSKIGLGTVCTSCFFTEIDRAYLKNAKSQEEWEKYQLKRDLYALTKSFEWEILFPQELRDEYKDLLRERSDPIMHSVKLMLFYQKWKINETFGDEFFQAIQDALKEDPDQRPSIDAMIEITEDAITGLSTSSP